MARNKVLAPVGGVKRGKPKLPKTPKPAFKRTKATKKTPGF